MIIGSALLMTLAAAAPSLQAEQFDTADGLDVVLVQVPGATRVALRVVVRSGAAQDPWKRNGLAHVLEHLIFHGTYDLGGDDLQDLIEVEGATYNAFTSPDDTQYQLEAPKGAWLALAGRYLDAVTNPAVTLSTLDKELGVVDVEAQMFSARGLHWLADLVLFPGNRGGPPVIGSTNTRWQLTFRDLTEFYAQHYVPNNTTFMVVGDVSKAQVELLLSEHVHWPPQPDVEAPQLAAMDLNVPVSQSVPGPLTGVIFGYHVPELDAPSCEALSRLLELRLTSEIIAEDALASQVSVRCTSLRGHRLLLATTISGSFQGAVLPDLVEETFASAASTPTSGKEVALIRRREDAQLRAAWADPGALANRLHPALLRSGPERTATLQALLHPSRPSPAALQRAARDAFKPERRILVHLTPFER
ncbi:MAG: insulinase family protein [Deltaproteobacteria bacterium]|nr:insulinase family protein [Deltaproteobacteria bacterium]